MFIIYAALVVVASLNRETGVLLVACYAAFYARHWRQVAYRVRVAILFCIWALITLVLHLLLGEAPHILGLAGTLRHNLRFWVLAVLYNSLLLPLWLALIAAYRPAPLRLKWLAWCGLAYVATCLVGAAWMEVRLLLTIVPLVLPLLIYQKSPS